MPAFFGIFWAFVCLCVLSELSHNKKTLLIRVERLGLGWERETQLAIEQPKDIPGSHYILQTTQGN